MLASDNVYFSPGRSSPDGEEVFGSLRDWCGNMSNEAYRPTIEILNDQDSGDPNLSPVWLMMPQTKAYYDGLTSGLFATITNDAISVAASAGKDVTRNTNRRICIIYAGNRRTNINGAAYLGGDRYLMFERWEFGPQQYNVEYQDARFTHMGAHTHEFAHVRGFHHDSSNRWSVLGDGQKNGPGPSFAACPAALNPWHRSLDSWISLTTITGDINNADLVYNATPNNYKIDLTRSDGNAESFLVENRQFTSGYDRHLPGANGGTGGPGGLLIWNISGTNPRVSNAVDLIEADNTPINDATSLPTDIFRPDGAYPYDTMSDCSSPTSLKFRNGTPSHFSVEGYTANGATITVSFKTRHYWTGTITSNVTWSDEAIVCGNVTVNSGVILTIDPGTSVIFNSGTKLTVNGSLQAIGTSANPITFDRSGASGTWSGIWIENSTANSTLDYCTVQNSTYGVRLNNTSGNVTIDHATLTNNSFGLITEFSSPFTIQNSTIQNNAYGIYVRSSAASGLMKILSNTITSNSNYHGIYLYDGADAYVGFNTIANNTQNGIYCLSNSDPLIRSASPDPDYGNNIIHSNGGAGVKAATNSWPSLGLDHQTPGLKDYYGYNEIHSNGGAEVDNNNGGTDSLMAKRNYWSSNYNQAATPEDLNGLVAYQRVLGGIETAVGIPPYPTLAKQTTSFEKAFELEIQDQFEAAAALYLDLLEQNPDADNVGFGISGLIRCYKGMNRRSDILTLTDNLIKLFPGTKVQSSAKDHSLPYLVQIGDHDTAIMWAAELLAQNLNSSIYEPNYLFQLASMFEMLSGGTGGADMSNAAAKYQELIRKYPGSDFAFLATLELDRIGGSTLGRETAENLISITTPQSFVLYPNYPNPFNPETRIKFHLKNEQKVLLRIYDVSGKLVRTLVDAIYDRGDHMISWDSKDSNSLPVASGI